MDKTIAGLLGAVSALALAAPSQAAPVGPHDLDAAMAASSYSDLLKPIPNAKALLDAASATGEEDQAEAQGFDPQAVEEVQYHHHHHHHHWHRWHRRWWHRHRPVVVINPP